MHTLTRRSTVMLAALLLACVLPAGAALAQGGGDPPLATVPIPLPADIDDIVVDRAAAIALGKALFWDMQLGSDGVQACASCHFQAGADNRVKNQVSPGLLAGDTTFQVRGPNQTLVAGDFPFHQRVAPVDEQASAVLRDFLDVGSSQGVYFNDFNDIVLGSPVDDCTPIADPVFNVGGINVRRVEPRNSPTTINAIFFLDNFWDGRASRIFNGNNPFGAADQEAPVWVNDGGTLAEELMRLQPASLASQAVGPPLSDFEMSCARRTFAKVGKKMLSLTPLGTQLVHPNDSVLGAMSNSPNDGINASYAAMIQAAFHTRYWDNTTQIIEFQVTDDYWHEPEGNNPRGYYTENGVPTILPHPGGALSTAEFTQMEANFSMFFGIAVMLYEATLISDDAPIDRFFAGDDNAISDAAKAGMSTFDGAGHCDQCHAGTLFTNALVDGQAAGIAPDPGEAETPVELMAMAQGVALYDNGFYNISVTPTAEDIGRGGTTPFINPLTGDPFPLSFTRMAILKARGLLPPDVATFVFDLPPANRAIIRGIDRLAQRLAVFEEQIAEAELEGNLALVERLTARAERLGAQQQAQIARNIAREGARAARLDAQIADAQARGNVRRAERLIAQRDRQVQEGAALARVAVDGAFKVPTLRNVELTGPYMHDGSMSTLRQVVEFYTRGGNHPQLNIDNLDPDIDEIGKLRGADDKKDEVVAFLLTLTDERVAFERAPFDHPELRIPHGSVPNNGDPSDDIVEVLPAVGADGRAERLPTFLNLDPTTP